MVQTFCGMALLQVQELLRPPVSLSSMQHGWQMLQLSMTASPGSALDRLLSLDFHPPNVTQLPLSQ